MGNNYSARSLVLSKRVKNYWHKSGQSSYTSLKVWARSSDDKDVRAWLDIKGSRLNKIEKTKIVKTKPEVTQDAKKRR